MEGIPALSGSINRDLGNNKDNEPIDRSNMGSRRSTGSEIDSIVNSGASTPSLEFDNLKISYVNLEVEPSSTVPMEEDSKGLSEDNLDDTDEELEDIMGSFNNFSIDKQDLDLKYLHNISSEKSGRSSLPGIERDVIEDQQKVTKVLGLPELQLIDPGEEHVNNKPKLDRKKQKRVNNF